MAQDFAWPTSTGSRQRLANIIDALSRVGDVDLFSLAWRDRPDPLDLPADAPVRRSEICFYPAGYPFPDVSLSGRAQWLRSGLPYELSAGDFASTRRAFEAWQAGPYDLYWFSRASTFALLGDAVRGNVIIDLDDLEDHKHRARLAAATYPTGPRGQLHRVTAEAQGRLNISRWRRLHSTAAAHSQALVVCSDLDRQRVALPSAVVVPNGYRRPEEPLGGHPSGKAPVVLMQGVLFYPPNSDGARWLVHDILPILREQHPGVTVRLVGANGPDIQSLDQLPGVEVTGRVPSMEPELAGADLIAVPIRFGSGTRVKILEGFAHRIPVVATTLGAEGLDVVAGRHLLIADDPAGFAAVCHRVLTEPQLRADLVDAAETLFRERYDWATIGVTIQNLATSVAGTPRTPGAATGDEPATGSPAQG